MTPFLQLPWFNRVKELYQKYERFVPATAFFLGFIFDVLTLRRIDAPDVLIQQAVCLVIALYLTGIESLEKVQSSERPFEPPRLLRPWWRYREFIFHFVLGTLLNSYAIFYFKSASGITSILFVLVLVVLLTAIEFKRFGQNQTRVHLGLTFLCLITYLQTLVPILIGTLGTGMFLISTLVSAGITWAFIRSLKRRSGQNEMTRLLLPPAWGSQAVFVLLYVLQVIPPVPLSVSYLGIYHGVEKVDGAYHLKHEKPWYRFWQHGDETFFARPGDVVHAFAQIFSPTGFEGKLIVRWSWYQVGHGWQVQDSIPLTVLGGREEGYRAVTKKVNYTPGAWRIQILTADERELGRMGFEIIATEESPRNFQIEVR